MDIYVAIPEQNGRHLDWAERVGERLRSSRLGAAFSRGECLDHASREDLRGFGELASLSRVPDDEAEILLEALLPAAPRSEELSRIETYACLLGLARMRGGIPSETDLLSEAQAFAHRLPEELNDVVDGWLRYSVRDLLAVAHEAVFQEVVQELERQAGGRRRSVSSRAVLEGLTARVEDQSDALNDLGLLAAGEDPGELSFRRLFDRVRDAAAGEGAPVRGLKRWRRGPKEEELIAMALAGGPGVLAVLPVAWVLSTLRAEPWTERITEPFEVRGDFAWNRLGVIETVSASVNRFLDEDWPLPAVMAELAARTIDQHLRMAWARLAADARRDVAVLTTDGDAWWHRKKFFAGRTASRLPQAVGWLRQLRLVDLPGLTSAGSAAYEKCLRILREPATREVESS